MPRLSSPLLHPSPAPSKVPQNPIHSAPAAEFDSYSSGRGLRYTQRAPVHSGGRRDSYHGFLCRCGCRNHRAYPRSRRDHSRRKRLRTSSLPKRRSHRLSWGCHPVRCLPRLLRHFPGCCGTSPRGGRAPCWCDDNSTTSRCAAAAAGITITIVVIQISAFRLCTSDPERDDGNKIKDSSERTTRHQLRFLLEVKSGAPRVNVPCCKRGEAREYGSASPRRK